MKKNDIEDIEILDLDDDIEDKKEKVKKDLEKESKKTLEETKELVLKKKKKTKKKEEKKVEKGKYYKAQVIFCSISALFILGCCIFYGSRMIKYYKIYNPKASDGKRIQLLANEITSKSEIVYNESGLYINAGNYIYKGDVQNNYVKYANMLWRIVRINKDDTIEMVLDDYINIASWGSKYDYLKSDIYTYLNNEFIKKLDKDSLVNSNICTDKFKELSSITCNNTNNDGYVNLLSVTTFLNSIVDKKTYLASEDEVYWLRDSSDSASWNTNGVNVSLSSGDNFYEIRPVVTLKSSIAYNKGDGSIDNPYLVENNKNLFGSYIKLGDDLWQIYDSTDNYRLVLADNLKTSHRFSYSKNNYDVNDEGSVANYLNNEYLDSLAYKDKIIENTWYTGEYNTSYKDVLKDKVTARVGMLNYMDVKLNSDVEDYFLLTSTKDDSGSLMLVYGDALLKKSKNTISRSIRPCITISKNIKLKGSGTLSDPFVEA